MSQISFELGDDDLPDPTYGVRELADAVNQVLRRGFRDGAWVRGEIEGVRTAPTGHVYFNLTERDDDAPGGARTATLAVTLFAGTAARLRPVLARNRLRLANGLNVRIHGNLDLYAASGKLSLIMDGLDASFTLGRLAADRDQLLRRLVAEGLLDRQSRLVFPVAPLRLGLVTSRGSAAWHDVVHELEASRIGFTVLACDVRVQGDRAAEQVASAITTLADRACDVILVVRGGGSRTDLATFDAEIVARTIAACRVPILTGLGHEIDRAVADEVAHASYKTPTACASAVVLRVLAHQGSCEDAWSTVQAVAGHRLRAADRATHTTARRVRSATVSAVALGDQRLGADVRRLARAARAASADANDRLARLGAAIPAAGRRPLAALASVLSAASEQLARRGPTQALAADRSIDSLEARVRALDPARLLAVGWSITHTSQGSLVRRPADAPSGSTLVTTTSGGTVRSTVEESP